MTLFLYVLRDFFKFVLGALALCVFLFLLFDFIHKTTRYIPRYDPETKDLIEFYLYQIPNLVIQTLPIASLLASVITMVLLSRTNEITAMRAVGMGPLRIGAPIAVGGMILVLGSFIVGELLLPKTAQRVHDIQEVKIEKGSVNQLAEGARWVRKDGRLFNFKDFDPLTSIMYKVRVIEMGTSFRPKKTIEAETAVYRPESNDWLLSHVKMLYFWPNGTLSYTEEQDFLSLEIPAEPKKLKRERRLPNELSLSELNDIISKGSSSGQDILSYRVDMHVKMAFHFASFVVSLIGLKFGYKSERSMETAKGILLALGIGLSYWFFLNSGRALSKQGEVPPILGAWSANFIVLGLSWLSIIRTRKT
ncbi:LPS export ABC transporter permease LptG [Pseudobacteriovorax antillogorgiicola]|uniref:LPS export ABC transporter permease LptG n=1 Tax=Pseudobacteriovorax antillogorgiicola TaxID=1513793 RepID=A0A1Y6B2W4_9BACT|nr:LPS export ABC transporter permease LptG [Pseudobacteriovorax antillogorgiicola]TCS59389.1 LPS export ABC transporter permease LptG [Pseudobacteriovorax antillogorgiicola]SME88718.1 LPS export ABC transporter permease LptG [Pseudobacteriovorax antillogorgiicola]